MKKSLLLVVAFLFGLYLSANDWVAIKSSQPSEAKIQLVNADRGNAIVSISIDGFHKNLVQTPRGEAWLLMLEDAGFILDKGSPQLPLEATSLIIPDQAGTKVNILASEYTEYTNVLVAPSKGNLTRDIDPSTVPYQYGKVYDQNRFYPGDLVELSEPYIVRDYRGQAVRFMPFQYNPVTKVLRVYHNMTIEVLEDGTSDINSIQRDKPLETVVRPFHEIYSSHFLNYNLDGLRYDPVDEEGNMIVISYADFMDEMEPFVHWKRQKGIHCSLVDVATIGGAEDIKDFIKSSMLFSDLTYVLLVGDAAQVPTSNIGGNDSDVDYSYQLGDDHYPDLFVGRFSAETEAQVTTQVNRTLDYEQDPLSDTSWYRKAIGIASSEGPGDDGEMDYEHIRNIQDNKLIPFTYNYGYELFDGSQGGNDNNGNPTPAQVATCVNSGATIINYTGHGSTTSWGSSGFGSSHVNALTNTGNWPFIISVACVNGNFVNATCFAEAWLRAEDGGEPTGAIATIMSTINQSWNPPMHGQDEMNDILSEAYDGNIKRTFGGITMNGCMGMNDVYGSQGDEMTDTWTIFGDPSVVVRTDIPSIMTVTHPDTLEMDDASVTISCDADGGYASLSLDGVIIGTAVVENGEAVITFPPLNDAGTADIVVTAFNYLPYISTIEMVGVIGPMVVYADNEVNDEMGNDDGLVDYAEEIYLSIDLENIGSEDAVNVSAQLSTNSSFIEMLVQDTVYGTIAAGETASVTDGFAFQVSSEIPDGELLQFSISAADESGRGVWESSFELTAHAPVLELADYEIDDEEGNGNGKLDAGETADLTVELVNTGSSEAYNVMSQLLTQSEYISVLTEEVTLGNLEGGNTTAYATFKVNAAGDTPPGHLAGFHLQVIADHNLSMEEDLMAIVGRKPVLILDLAGNSSTADTLENCLDILTIEPDKAFQIPEYPDVYHSIFVLLGVYPDNHILTEEQGQALANFLQNGGRIYMEGGDTWFSDDPTTLHPMFSIQGLEDGSNDASELIGEKNTFLEGFSFTYTGRNNFIDRIAPLEEAKLIMSNNDPVYGVAVANENEVYRTIGSSVLFGGFEDQPGSSKDEMVAGILDFFEVGYLWTSIFDREVIDADVSAYPNPFKEQVTIKLDLEKSAMVRLEVFDLTGRQVATLAREQLSAGVHSFVWDANDGKVNPGIYFYNLKIDEQVITKKLVLNK